MSEDEHKKEIDEISGVETTGHSWDGLQELNNPLPRWWVWVWLVTIVWSLWYFVIYPSWPAPGGNLPGISGYTMQKELAENQALIQERQAAYLSRFEDASFDEILNDEELYAFAMAGGEATFKDNCATCHGSGGSGAKGFPNLNDDDWLWGGKLTDIQQTLRYGIRSGDPDARVSQMPSFGKDGLLSTEEINHVVDYVLSLSNPDEDSAHHAAGAKIFKEQCATCHGPDAKGMHEFGAPNLTDSIWLYGGDRSTVYETIYYARAGVMPAWKERLGENTIKQLSVYLHQLGGGEDEMANGGSTMQNSAPVEDAAQIEEMSYNEQGSNEGANQPTEH